MLAIWSNAELPSSHEKPYVNELFRESAALTDHVPVSPAFNTEGPLIL